MHGKDPEYVLYFQGLFELLDKHFEDLRPREPKKHSLRIILLISAYLIIGTHGLGDFLYPFIKNTQELTPGGRYRGHKEYYWTK